MVDMARRRILKGGAPRSELEFTMIASGNHSLIQRLWRAGARHSAPLKPVSLVTFLSGHKKVTPPAGCSQFG